MTPCGNTKPFALSACNVLLFRLLKILSSLNRRKLFPFSNVPVMYNIKLELSLETRQRFFSGALGRSYGNAPERKISSWKNYQIKKPGILSKIKLSSSKVFRGHTAFCDEVLVRKQGRALVQEEHRARRLVLQDQDREAVVARREGGEIKTPEVAGPGKVKFDIAKKNKMVVFFTRKVV